MSQEDEQTDKLETSLVVQSTEDLNIEPTGVDTTTGEKIYKIKGSLVRNPDGSLVPTSRFKMLGLAKLDDYSDLEFTETDIKRMHGHILGMRMGTTAVAPLLCSGPVKCVFRQKCPLIDQTLRTPSGGIDYVNQNPKKFPLFRGCIFEAQFLDAQKQSYIDEFQIDVDSPTEMMLINKLAELDLYDYRASLILAHGDRDGDGGDLLKEQTTGFSPDGSAEIKRLELHPAFEIKERIMKARANILEAMVGTRREQYKQAAALRQENKSDPSTIVAQLKQKILQIEQGEVDVIDTEFTEDLDEST